MFSKSSLYGLNNDEFTKRPDMVCATDYNARGCWFDSFEIKIIM